MKGKYRIPARKRNSYLEKMEQAEQKKQANKLKKYREKVQKRLAKNFEN